MSNRVPSTAETTQGSPRRSGGVAAATITKHRFLRRVETTRKVGLATATSDVVGVSERDWATDDIVDFPMKASADTFRIEVSGSAAGDFLKSNATGVGVPDGTTGATAKSLDSQAKQLTAADGSNWAIAEWL